VLITEIKCPYIQFPLTPHIKCKYSKYSERDTAPSEYPPQVKRVFPSHAPPQKKEIQPPQICNHSRVPACLLDIALHDVTLVIDFVFIELSRLKSKSVWGRRHW